jgi:ribonuclease P protein subunit RPR2
VAKSRVRDIAEERINIIVTNALRSAGDNQNIANSQTQLAKRIAMRVRLRLGYEIRQLYCKKCKYFIIPGRNSRIRIGRSNVKALRITCLRCGHIYRKIIKRSKRPYPRGNKDL